MGRAHLIILVIFCAWIGDLHADAAAHRALTMDRFKEQCEVDGNGKACYSYGRALWSTRGVAERKAAMHYLSRGCELKYDLACKSYHDHLVVTHYTRKNGSKLHACYSSKELDNAKFTPNVLPSGKINGQKITGIKPNSFWEDAGVKNDDVLVKVNNQSLNSMLELKLAFGNAGKKFGFELRRTDDTMTQFYDCDN